MSDIEFTVKFTHRLRFTSNCFDLGNTTLIDLLEPYQKNKPASVMVFVDENVSRCHGELKSQIERYAEIHADRLKIAGPITSVAGGETIKNDWNQLEPILNLMDQSHLCRNSYVIAVGGGAVLDAVGLAAGLFHRGVRLIRIVTTTLSQADAGMGVKNGINGYGKKNAVGMFSCPWAVINDESFLSTLSDEDWRCGFSEVIKVALLKDAALFATIETQAERIARRDMGCATELIRQSAQMHFDHIVYGGDAFEARDSRPLDFGHWAAHKLEHLSGFEMRHGETVAIGIALDVTYAKLMGLLPEPAWGRVINCLNALGFTLNHPLLKKSEELLLGLDEFREHLGGQLMIPLIRDIGEMIEIHEIDTGVMREAIAQFFDNESPHSPNLIGQKI